MPRDYNINISVGGGDARGAFSGGNVARTRSTLNTRKISEDGGGATDLNLSRIFTIGLAFNKAQQANELVGAYTENRLRQRQINQGMTALKYAIGIYVNPAVGLAYAGGDMIYRSAQYAIKVQKKNREANYFNRLSGNTSQSGRRYRGDYL